MEIRIPGLRDWLPTLAALAFFGMALTNPALAQTAGTNVTTILQTVGTLITGQLGTAIIVICVAFAGVELMIHHRGTAVWYVLGGAVLLYSAAWVATELGGSAGTGGG